MKSEYITQKTHQLCTVTEQINLRFSKMPCCFPFVSRHHVKQKFFETDRSGTPAAVLIADRSPAESSMESYLKSRLLVAESIRREK